MNIGMSSEGLLGLQELFVKTWAVYKRRLTTLIVMGLSAVLLPALAFAPFAGLGFVLSPMLPGMKAGVIAGAMVLGVGAAVWVMGWVFSAFLLTVVDETCGIKKAFSKARPKALGYVWLAALTVLILGGAHLLFVIPGIIMTVWFFFGPFVFINEDVGGMDALLKSKEYVRDRWLAVAVRLLAIWFISALVSAIPFIGPLAALFMVPFSFVYTFLLYKDLKESRGDWSFQPSKREKIGFVAAGTMGYALPVVVILTFMGSMVTLPFSMLKASVTGQSPGSLEMGKAAPHAPGVRHPHTKNAINTIKKPKASSTAVTDHAKILSDPSQDWTKRSQAAFRLGLSSDPKAAEALMQALKTDEQWVVRKNAVKALETLQVQQAVPLLIQVLESDKNVFVREAAAKALGQMGDESAVPSLRAALEDPGVVMTEKDGKTVEVKSVVKAAETALKRFGATAKTASAVVGESPRKTTGPVQGEQGEKRTLPSLQKGTEAEERERNQLTQKEKDALTGRIQACTKAIKIQPEDALAYHHRAVAHFKLGNYEKAIADFTKALEITPTESAIYYNRAAAYAMLGKYTQAVEDGTKSIKLNSQFPDAYLNRGIDYLATGRVKKALADFEKVTELNTKDDAGYYARGLAKWRLGSQGEAAKDFRKAADMGNEKARQYLETSARFHSQS
jgi:tetratricopeptide (TPR) repeat protein